MSDLSSANNIGEIKAAYANNASYVEDGSPAKARKFITACRMLIMRLPKRVSVGGGQGEEVELEVRTLQDQIGDAQRFLTTANVAAAPTRCYSIEHFRD